MSAFALVKLLEHNNWANATLLEACASLSDEQLDARDDPDAWSLRETLIHLVNCQKDYLCLLHQPDGERFEPAAYEELQTSAKESGDGLLALVDDSEHEMEREIRASDGYAFKRWVVLVQVLNHANDHRRQASFMLRRLGVTPPKLDGWSHGEATGALTKLVD